MLSSRIMATRGSYAFNTKSTVSILPGSLQRLPMEQDKQVKARKEAFETCWEAVEKEIKAIMLGQHDKIMEDLLHFISLSREKLQSLHSKVTTAQADSHQAFSPLPEIYTAVLVAGMNRTDHKVLFERLREKICSEATPHVVTLKAKDCNSGMKATMQRIMLQLTQRVDQIIDKHRFRVCSSDEESAPKPPPTKRRAPHYCMRNLCTWYQDNVAKSESRPPVVMIVEDLEGFQPTIIQDLILSLSGRQAEFPCVLVLGVATSVDIIQQLLSRQAISLLSTQQFHTQQSSVTLAHIIKRVFLTHHFPFKLGPKALNFLLHQFFYWNLSLADFTRGLKLTMMEHFDWQPLSPLCAGVPATVWSRVFMECVRATPSMQRFIESLAPQKRLNLLENDSKLKGQVKVLLGKLEQYHQIFYPLLSCLHCLIRDLPEAPLGKKLHEVYLLSLEHNIVETSKFEKAWGLVKMLGKDPLKAQVQLCVEELKIATSSTSGLVRQVMGDTLDIFETFCAESSRQENTSDTRSQPTCSSSPAAPILTETTAERKLKLQERLSEVASRRETGVSNVFESAHKKMTDALLDVFTRHLQAPKHLPLHEVFYYDQLSFMQAHLSPAPRAVIQKGLTQPAYFLAGAGQSSDTEGTVSPDQPDVSILYQLHLESGKLINLYDLLQSFNAVLCPIDGSRDEADPDSKKTSIDPIMHARFIQALNVLQLLGFIKHTQRRVDHVQRLTWGPL